MKFISTILITVLLFSSFQGKDLNSHSKNLHEVKFKVTNLKNTKGQILIALFNSEKTFLKEGFKTQTVPIKNKEEVIIIFNNIPEGVYAASIIHDENNNGNLDTSWMKIPKEPYAFSNNARGSFGPADFEDAKFLVNSETVIQEIKLK